VRVEEFHVKDSKRSRFFQFSEASSSLEPS